jgi:Ca-activated chloride channel family protein
MTRLPSIPPLSVALVAALLVGAAEARADGFLVPTTPGRPVRGEWAVSHHKVDVGVRGPHARVTVDQEFVNLSAATLEAEYVFPLPRGAMVSAVTLFEQGRGLEGRILRAEEARRAYEEIVRRQRDPALLEYLGQDLFRVRVFPIPAGGRRRVVLKYDQLLSADAGTVEFVYPLNTEKFSARPLDTAVVSVDIAADVPLGPIYSPSHDVAVERRGPSAARVSWEASRTLPRTDFLLYWAHTRNAIGASLLTWWPRDEDRGYFLFLASPSVGGEGPAATRPKQITFVVDTSGSMAGEKIEQVRAALRQVIGGLNPGDRFNVVAYHTVVLPLWPAVRLVTPENQREALGFAQGLRAEGGTNVKEALEFALAGTPPEDLASVILFLTDGRPTVGETDVERIVAAVGAANRGKDVRLFAFGVGVDVNAVLLDRLALENRGVPSFARPGEDVERRVASLYEKIRYPVLTDLVFEARGLDASEPLPRQLPDLFRGSQVVLAGRYGKGGRVETVLSGSDGAVTREYHAVLPAALRGEGVASDFPARVWATRRIAELVDQVRLAGRADPEIVGEIVRLSTKFGILTEYTAFLADETADHGAVAKNAVTTGASIRDLAGREVGGAGFAQSENQQARRDATRAPAEQGWWVSDRGDRDVRREAAAGVIQAGNRAFYRRAQRWVDARVADPDQVEEIVERWSPRFFDLLASTTPEENARLAQEGTLVLELAGRVIMVR